MGDMFGGLAGLGGLMKGLSGFMPQDDPKVKMMNAENEVAELKKQETEILAEIGRGAIASDGIAKFGETGERLRLVQSNLKISQSKLGAMKEEKDREDRAQKEASAATTCQSCGHRNPEGTKFCQECGAKIGGKTFCTECGAELAPGTRFCGECGARQD